MLQRFQNYNWILKKPLMMSKWLRFLVLVESTSDYLFTQREWQEYHVYTTLCSGSPNLEERIVDGDYKEMPFITDLVSASCHCQIYIYISELPPRYKKAPQVQGQMIWRVWRVLYWIGSCLKVKLSPPVSLRISNMTGAFSMSALVFFYVLLVKTGITKSEITSTHCLTCIRTDETTGLKKRSEVVS